MMSEDRRVWAVMIFPSGPAAAEVVGAVRGSKRLHWTMQGARDEADTWIDEFRIGPIQWQILDDEMAIGRNSSHVVVIRGILLPRGGPPR
jgi:hypothetical protein